MNGLLGGLTWEQRTAVGFKICNDHPPSKNIWCYQSHTCGETPTEFHDFPKLSDELQMMIWRRAAHETRLLAMSDNSVCDTHSDSTLVFLSPYIVKAGLSSPSSAQPNPAIFYVDGLSNEVAKEKYTVHVPVPLCNPPNPALDHDRQSHQLVNGTTRRYINRGTDIIYLKGYDAQWSPVYSFLKQMKGSTNARTFHRFAIDACHMTDPSYMSFLESTFHYAHIKLEMLFVLAGSEFGSGENGAAARKIRTDLRKYLKDYGDSCAIRRFKWVESNEDLEVYEDQYGEYDIDVEDD